MIEAFATGELRPQRPWQHPNPLITQPSNLGDLRTIAEARKKKYPGVESHAKAFSSQRRKFPESVTLAGVGITFRLIKFLVVAFPLTVYPSLRYPARTILSEYTKDLLTGRGGKSP